jgi:hypothetical protein
MLLIVSVLSWSKLAAVGAHCTMLVTKRTIRTAFASTGNAKMVTNLAGGAEESGKMVASRKRREKSAIQVTREITRGRAI